MITNYDSEAIIKIYRMLAKKCDVIDRFIKNHAYYFGPCTEEFGASDVCNNIIDLITRKNQLINLKIIVDNAIEKLSPKDKKVLMIKMHYSISMNEICGILNMKERTAFRRIEQAFDNLADILNRSKHAERLERIINNEDWICAIREDVRDRRMAYHQAVNSI